METLIANKKKEESIISPIGGCVFLVDDNPVFLSILESEIKEIFPFAKIKSFLSGEAALSAISREHPFLVFLDYDLAGASTKLMNGIAVLKKIKKEIPDTEVVMLSGIVNLKIVITSMKYGAFDYILKGEKTFHDIRHNVGKILRRLRIKEERHKYNGTIKLIKWIAILIIISFLFGLYNYYRP